MLLIGFAEGLGAAKTYAAQGRATRSTPTGNSSASGSQSRLRAGSGMVVNGSLSKTAVNGGAGAKTQV